MKANVSTLLVNITTSEFICEKLKESLARTAKFYIETNSKNLEIHRATIRGLMDGDTSSEIVRKSIQETHRKVQFASANLSDWGLVLAEINKLSIEKDAVEEADSLEDIMAMYK